MRENPPKSQLNPQRKPSQSPNKGSHRKEFRSGAERAREERDAEEQQQEREINNKQ